MSMISRRYLLAFCLASLGGTTAPSSLHAQATPRQAMRLLTVGNSFSRNATEYLDELAAAGGKELVHQQAVIGGSTMAQHWEKAQRHEADPADPQGLYSNKKSLKEMLLAGPWDFITMQQASIRSHDIANYRPSAADLLGYIRKLAPQAEVVIHQTWEYRKDDPRFTKPPTKPGEPPTQLAMYEGLTKAYETIAAELGLRLIPVGDAFHLADTDAQWGYQTDSTFDFKLAKPPALPDQTHSLHVGWQWKKQKDGSLKLTMDGHHANVAGQYLGACVFYEFLFGESCVGNSFKPENLDAAHARFLQETAHRAVTSRRTGTAPP